MRSQTTTWDDSSRVCAASHLLFWFCTQDWWKNGALVGDDGKVFTEKSTRSGGKLDRHTNWHLSLIDGFSLTSTVRLLRRNFPQFLLLFWFCERKNSNLKTEKIPEEKSKQTSRFNDEFRVLRRRIVSADCAILCESKEMGFSRKII